MTNSNLNLKFTSSGTYTVSANYSLSDGSNHYIVKSVNVN